MFGKYNNEVLNSFNRFYEVFLIILYWLRDTIFLGVFEMLVYY